MKEVLAMAKDCLAWLRCNQAAPAKSFSKMREELEKIGLPVIRQLQAENLIASSNSHDIEAEEL
jgi:hypothetical protein